MVYKERNPANEEKFFNSLSAEPSSLNGKIVGSKRRILLNWLSLSEYPKSALINYDKHVDARDPSLKAVLMSCEKSAFAV